MFPKLPVIAITGGNKIDPPFYMKVADKFGADLTISKPFELDELVRAVERLLSESIIKD
jgi:CheY-like chemotaxis protein